MAFTEEEIKEFRIEAEELLDSAEKSLLALDKGELFATHYDAIFRAFHSIKGAAGMMEMTALQSHMHQMESKFTEQKNEKNLSKPYIDFFLKGADAARSIIGGKEVDFDYSVSQAAGSDAKVATPSPVKASAAPAGAPPNPVAAEPRPTTPASVAAPAASGPAQEAIGRVLVIDDQPDVVDLLMDILKTAHFDVVGTTSPEEGLRLAATFKPDAVLSDISMPEMDGMQLLAAINKSHPDIPVVFVSGHVSKEWLMEAIQLGAFGVVEKPFTVARVVESCLNAVRKCQMARFVNRSMNLILYQFSDLDAFLKAQGKDDIRNAISHEINALIAQRRKLRFGKSAPSN